MLETAVSTQHLPGLHSEMNLSEIGVSNGTHDMEVIQIDK